MEMEQFNVLAKVYRDSLDVHVSIYSFLDTFAGGLIVAIENKEKEMKKGGKK